MANVARWIRHNQGMTVAVAAAIIVMLWTFGCESKVTSLIEPAKMVTSAELKIELETESRRLEAELELLISKAKLKTEELVRQDDIKRKLFDFAAITVDAGTVNPAGVVGLLFSVFGIGAVIDNRIKDKVIKNRSLKG